MKRIVVVMFMIFSFSTDLVRKSLGRWRWRHSHYGFCHAWTNTRGITTTRSKRFESRKNNYPIDDWRSRRHHTRSSSSSLLHSNREPWNGDMDRSCEFFTHVRVGKGDSPVTVESAILRSMTALGSSSSWQHLSEEGKSYVVQCNHTDTTNESTDATTMARSLWDQKPNSPMTPRQLLYLGCIYYLPAQDYRNNEEFKDRSDLIKKPSRLSFADAPRMLHEGDYLRIHHTPRRFPWVYKVDWSFLGKTNNTNTKDAMPVVVQQQGPGYCIIDKPPMIPVHPTVDNDVENVAHQLALALKEQEQLPPLPLVNSSNTGQMLKGVHNNNTTSANLREEDLPYVAVIQRLDINTSGLLVVATSPEFAAYFSNLLQRKTKTILDHNNSKGNNVTTTATNNTAAAATSPTIEKGYKCLVCIQTDESSGESVIDAWKRLSNLQRPKPQQEQLPSPSKTVDDDDAAEATSKNTNNTLIIRHFLKASDRAPKLFVDAIPQDENGNPDTDSKWYECLMEITNVGEPIPLYASSDEPSSSLADSLWPKVGTGNNNRMPPMAKAVVEVEVSLITGRTHQIRGQLSKLGFPIVGDEQYGGAVPISEIEQELQQEDFATATDSSEDPQLLALQCCQLGFRDAEYELVWNKKKRRDVLRGRPSRNGRWVRATLQNAWWTPFLEAHTAKDGNQFSDIDFQDADEDDDEIPQDPDTPIDINNSIEQPEIRSDMLPPAVQLSPGRNKYVVAKLRDPATEKVRWFVISAPLPYHAEVAFDLVEWIHAVPGYEQTAVQVTGGGRIDYNPSASTASVYGFSYRYGKGDHARVAQLIEASDLGAGLQVTFDLSDNLY